MVSNKGVIMAYAYNMLREDKGIPFGGCGPLLAGWLFVLLLSPSLTRMCVSCQTWSCTTRRWRSFTTSPSTTPSKWLPVDETRNATVHFASSSFVVFCLKMMCNLFFVNKWFKKWRLEFFFCCFHCICCLFFCKKKTVCCQVNLSGWLNTAPYWLRAGTLRGKKN